MNMIKKQLLSFGLLFVVALFRLATPVISAGLAAAGSLLEGLLPNREVLARVVNRPAYQPLC